MVEGMRADCLIVDSRPREEPFYHLLGTFSPILGSPWPASLASPGSPYSQPAANSSPGLQKAPQKSLKSSLESSKFMKKSKKQNLSKTSVFTMFYTHPSIRSCHDFQPRTTEKSIPQPMLQIWYPKVSKMTSKRVPWEPRIDQKSTKIKVWAPRCPVECLQ